LEIEAAIRGLPEGVPSHAIPARKENHFMQAGRISKCVIDRGLEQIETPVAAGFSPSQVNPQIGALDFVAQALELERRGAGCFVLAGGLRQTPPVHQMRNSAGQPPVEGRLPTAAKPHERKSFPQ
jgi:hypothetical protein